MSAEKVDIIKSSTGEDFLSVESFLFNPEAQKRCLAHKLTTSDEAKLRKAHKLLTGTVFEKTCSNCFEDAFFMLLNILKTKKKMSKYTLKNGAIIFVDNKPYSNKNITDEVALQHFVECPTSKMFTSVPTPEELRAFKSSVAGKKGAEIKAKKAAEEEAAKKAAEEEAAKKAAEEEAAKKAAEEEAKKLAESGKQDEATKDLE